MALSRAVVRNAQMVAPGVLELELAPLDPAEIAFRAGQFINLFGREDGAPIKRSYSIASPPAERGALRLCIRVVGGPMSRYVEALAPGDEVHYSGPMGAFTLDPTHAGDVVFAATGTGLAPILAMLHETLPRSEAGRVRLYWGVREEHDLFWRDRLAALAEAHPRLDVRLHLTRPGEAWRGGRGRITGALVADLPALDRPTFYLAGNGAMVRELRTLLVAHGVDRKRQVRSEAFFTLPAAEAA